MSFVVIRGILGANTDMAISGRRSGVHLWKSRAVGIVTLHAAIACSRTQSRVPVSRHATMRPVLIVSRLRSVTLCAELHGIRPGRVCAIREAELFIVAGIVAGRANQLSMLEIQAEVEALQFRGGSDRDGIRSRCVAC